jgi:hypothetical protein
VSPPRAHLLAPVQAEEEVAGQGEPGGGGRRRVTPDPLPRPKHRQRPHHGQQQLHEQGRVGHHIEAHGLRDGAAGQPQVRRGDVDAAPLVAEQAHAPDAQDGQRQRPQGPPAQNAKDPQGGRHGEAPVEHKRHEEARELDHKVEPQHRHDVAQQRQAPAEQQEAPRPLPAPLHPHPPLVLPGLRLRLGPQHSQGRQAVHHGQRDQHDQVRHEQHESEWVTQSGPRGWRRGDLQQRLVRWVCMGGGVGDLGVW